MKYYKQECKDGDKLSLPEHELEESPLTKLKGLSKTNSFEVEVDKDVMKKYFSSGVYSGYKSGLRELYNNEARACRNSLHIEGSNPEIHITIRNYLPLRVEIVRV